MSIIDELDLIFTLSAAGIETLLQFKGLQKKDVMMMKNAGIRTWGEIEKMQEYLLGPSRRDQIYHARQLLNDVYIMAKELDLIFTLSADGRPYLVDTKQ